MKQKQANDRHMKYYHMWFDDSIERPWRLSIAEGANGDSIRGDDFAFGRRVDMAEPLKIVMRYDGVRTDYTFGAFELMVANQHARDVLMAIAADDVQLLDAEVAGATDEYWVVNILNILPCLDEDRSSFTKWTEEDERPDKIGQYRGVSDLKIDPTKAVGHDIFRPWGWQVVVIVSERLKEAFESEKITGLKFIEV